ncbi:hypothetical protein ABPG75_001906 [Micractinium tetrahymenae]
MAPEQDLDVEQEHDADEYEDEAEEAKDSSSDSEADRREFGLYQCLPVEPGEPDWDTEEPQTVEEYLRRVRYEAQQLPDVVSAAALPPAAPSSDQQTAADAPHGQQAGEASRQQHRQRRVLAGASAQHGSSYLTADPGVQDCDPGLKPSSAWTRDFLQQFARLRRHLQREQEMLSEQAGGTSSGGGGGGGSGSARLSLLAGGAAAAMAAEELAALQLDPPSDAMPELQQLRGLDQLQVRRQLHSAIRAAVEEEVVAPEAAATLYALSARIEKPLHAGTCALYRQLLRHCAAQRAALGGASANAACDPRLAHLNIMITIAGAYFGQDEELATMWDDDEE